METAPAAALVVIEPDLVLELLEVALDAPADFHEADELVERDRGRHRRQPVLRGRRLAPRPLHEQPFDGTCHRALHIAVRRADADGGKPRFHGPARALAPAHALPRAGRQLRGERRAGERPVAGGAPEAARVGPPPAPRPRPEWRLARWPNAQIGRAHV